MYFNVSLTSTPGCSKRSLSLGPSNQTLNEFFITLKLDPCQTRIILLFLPPCHFQIFLSTLSLFFYVSRPSGGSELPHYRGFTITLFDTPYFVGFLWTSDQPDAETSNWKHRTLTIDRYSCHRRNSNSHSRHASGRRPTP